MEDPIITALRQKALSNLMLLFDRDAEYLANLPANKPVRNGARIQSNARLLLEYTQPKPAQKIETTGAEGGPVLSRIEVILVPALDGQRAIADEA